MKLATDKYSRIKVRFSLFYFGENTLLFPLLFFLPLFLSSCFTGIESTGKIKMSKEEKKSLEPKAEELYMSDISSIPNNAWLPGKLFYVADSKVSHLLDSEHNSLLERGDTIEYQESVCQIAPNGENNITLIFKKGNENFIYSSGKNSVSKDTIYSDKIPGLIDLEMIKRAENRLYGKSFWTLSTLWEDAQGKRVDGRKYAEVRIADVKPGTMIYPLKVKFNDNSGREGYFMLNFGNSANESHSFANMFVLSNPRKNYSNISDDNWEAICVGKVLIGMTKDEVKLAKGNPEDVVTGHDYSKAMLLWKYKNGDVLYFEDGILTGINKL